MSTPVVTSSPVADSAPALQIPVRGTPEYQHYRMTGELTMPEKKQAASDPATKEDAPAKTDDTSGAGANKPAEAAAASEAAQPQERRKRGNRDTRIAELLEENNRLRREAEGKKDVRQPEPSTGKQPPVKAEEYKPIDETEFFTKNPKATYAEYIDAVADHRADWKVAQALKQRDEAQANNKKAAEVKTQNEALIKEFQGNVDAARKEHADFDKVAFNEDLGKLIPKGSIVDLCILQTPLGAKTLYYLGQHPEKIGEILKLTPFQQSAELVKIQLTLEKPAARTTPAKTKSEAPDAPIELGGNGTTVIDETQRAAKADDFKSFREAANARDLAKRRKGS